MKVSIFDNNISTLTNCEIQRFIQLILQLH
jgi:hypothetical protein